MIDSSNKVNIRTLIYIANLDFKMQKTDINIQKINSSLSVTYDIVISVFQVFDKLVWSWFFQKTFLLADISIKIVFGIFLLTFNNANI